jgi:hypothetical protein
MTTTNYPSDRTGLLFVDPYNDFLSEGGKLWPLLKEIAEEETFSIICARSLRQRALQRFNFSSCRIIAGSG